MELISAAKAGDVDKSLLPSGALDTSQPPRKSALSLLHTDWSLGGLQQDGRENDLYGRQACDGHQPPFDEVDELACECAPHGRFPRGAREWYGRCLILFFFFPFSDSNVRAELLGGSVV